MHEQSLVRSLLRQIDEVLDANQARLANHVRVDVGPLSGVEPALVRLAFQELAPGSRCAAATLEMEVSPLLIRCADCQAESELSDFIFRCHRCQSGNVRVIAGDAFRLLTVTLDESAEIEHA